MLRSIYVLNLKEDSIVEKEMPTILATCANLRQGKLSPKKPQNNKGENQM
jgi:hypothetical protein